MPIKGRSTTVIKEKGWPQKVVVREPSLQSVIATMTDGEEISTERVREIVKDCALGEDGKPIYETDQDLDDESTSVIMRIYREAFKLAGSSVDAEKN